MRKLKIIEHISLDGVISPGEPGEYGDDYAHGGWTAPYTYKVAGPLENRIVRHSTRAVSFKAC